MSPSTPTNLFGTILCDNDVCIESVNECFAEWLGYPAGDLLGKSFGTLLTGGGQLYFQSLCLPILKLEGTMEEVYLSLRTKEGQALPVMFNATTHPREVGFGLEFAFVRIVRRARLEDELLRAKKLAEAANEAKAKFLAMMTHELRNPLQTLSLTTNLLLEESAGPITPPQRELLEASDEAAGNLARLIDDILDFARMQSHGVKIESTRVPASEALQRAEALLLPRLRQAGIDYQAHPVPDQIIMEGDPKRIQQILLNLLTNAMKFTPSGGRISTRILEADGQAHIEVEDSGCGISPQNLQRIFDAFVQLDPPPREAKGGGLGLAISRDLARAMRGSLHVRSTPGVGSVFTLALPLAPRFAETS
ncbi:MAG: HAMP domain-containing sensor histidine kinase [Verrucomicrobia bacterium]|nr:HAMP domain-containing sensor histidine kinase [Verrucomicrobiota bacterium]MDA1006448.1 HAMP domain-containing sensor histidine kinase [Verrucomicrobiota bacterium]